MVSHSFILIRLPFYQSPTPHSPFWTNHVMFKHRFSRATKPCYRLPDLWMVEEHPISCLPPSTPLSLQPDVHVNQLIWPCIDASAPGNWNDGVAAGSVSFNDGFGNPTNDGFNDGFGNTAIVDVTNGFGDQSGDTETPGGAGDQACRNCGEGKVLDVSLRSHLTLLRRSLCS